MNDKKEKGIFVIMPFTNTPKRNKEELTAFFYDVIKDSIESTDFKYRYIVNRSNDSFNITEKIITDIYNADILICDLSGTESNPNVMYELGIRLSLTDKPVILIREKNENNKPIFDIAGFFAYQYNPLEYKSLTKHLTDKIANYESGKDVYSSPVLSILKKDNPLLMNLSIHRAGQKLYFMRSGIQKLLNIFCSSMLEYFLEINISFDLGSNTNETFTNIHDKKVLFDTIDFTGFHCRLLSQPMIDSYLAEQYLNNLIEPNIVNRFTSYITSYHACYFGVDIFHNIWKSERIYHFIGETIIFITLIEFIHMYMHPDNKITPEDMAKKIDKYLEESKIYNWTYQ